MCIRDSSYLKKGQDIVDMNHKAIDMGATAYHLSLIHI